MGVTFLGGGQRTKNSKASGSRFHITTITKSSARYNIFKIKTSMLRAGGHLGETRLEADSMSV
jgi:hypothetical protein